MRDRASVLSVAERAGVSRQTVSNGILHPERLRPETLERVLGAIRDLHYVPHEAATRLRSTGRPLLGVAFGVDFSPTGMIDTTLATLVAQAAADRQLEVIAVAPHSIAGTNPTAADVIVAPQPGSSAPARRWSLSGFQPFAPGPREENRIRRVVGIDERAVQSLAIDYALARSPGQLLLASSGDSAFPLTPVEEVTTKSSRPPRADFAHITVNAVQPRAAFEAMAACEPTAIVCQDDFAAAACMAGSARNGRSDCLVIGVGATEISRQLGFPSVDLGLGGLARAILDIVVGDVAADGPDVFSGPFLSLPSHLIPRR